MIVVGACNVYLRVQNILSRLTGYKYADERIFGDLRPVQHE